MKDIIQSKGGKAVYEMLVSSAVLESAVSIKEIDPGNSISFLPKDTFNAGVTHMLIEQGHDLPVDNCGHYGGVTMGYVNTKGYGDLQIILDFNDLFVFNYTKQNVQLDYGRCYRETMENWLYAFATILNSNKSLRKKRMKVKDEYKVTTYKNDISYHDF
jgi:hypothetical protein